MHQIKTTAFTLLLSTLSIALLAQQDSVQQKNDILKGPSLLGISTEYAQIALIGNIADSGFSGTQIGVVFNSASDGMNGLQVAGIVNSATDSISGAQLAGVCNYARSVNGLQAAGSINAVRGNMHGVMLAGFANVTGGKAEFLQTSGSLNYATSLQGLQMTGTANIVAKSVIGGQFSGGLNYAGELKGLQAAGWINIVQGNMTGAQISGGINYASKVKGAQIGILNFADSVDGVTIGVFSFVRHGYHKLELAWTENMYANMAFHTGSRFFHNILSAGFTTKGNDVYWSYGYGVGSAFRLGNRIDLCLNLTGSHVNKNKFNEHMSELMRIDALTDIRLIKNLSITLGPSLNVFVYDRQNNSPSESTIGFVPYSAYDRTFDNRWKVNGWLGFRAGIRLF